MIELLNQPYIQRKESVQPFKKERSYVSIGGETRHLNEWLEKTGISYSCYAARINAGMRKIDAIRTPNANFKHITHNGLTLTTQQWADRIGITRMALHWRLKNWDKDRALTVRQ